MKPLRKRIEAKLGSVAFRRLHKWMLKKTDEQACRIGEKYGRLIHRFSKKHRLRTLANLELAFPEMAPAEREALAVKVFEHFGRVAADFLRTTLRTREDVLASTTVEGREYLDEAMAKGKGVLVVTAHFGNWERGGHWLTCQGHAMSVVARDANDNDLNNLVNDLRRSSGVEVISRGNAARPILHLLRKNGIVAILPDQNSGESYVPFFGKLAGTVQGPAVLALRSGAPLLPVFCLMAAPGKLHIIIRKPLEPEEGCEDPVDSLTRGINLALEETIRLYPDQYLWLHDRWKSARRRGLL
jgi:KDO2-lipid IV(A) lauroyltransferase